MEQSCLPLSLALVLLLLSGCALVPVGTLATSNAVTTYQHAEAYQRYDSAFRRAHEFVEHRIPRDQYQLYAREFGNVHRGTQPSIVMLHGFPDSLHLYDYLTPLLAKQRHVIVFDFLGWGNSDKPSQHRYDSASLRADLAAVVAYFQLPSIVLVVHDASGPPGIDWAMQHSDQLHRLVLLNTFYSPMPTLRAPEAIERFSTPGFARDLQRFGASISRWGWKLGFSSQVSKFFKNDTRRAELLPALIYQSFEARNAFFSLNDVLIDEVQQRRHQTERLRGLSKPVQIIFGTDDVYLNVGVAREFEKLFSRAQLFLIENAAHYVQVDQPEQVARIILAPDTP